MKRWFVRWVCGWKSGSELGSNRRRVISRGALVFALLIIAGSRLTYGQEGVVLEATSYIPVLFALGFFLFVVAMIPFLTRKDFIPNAVRLALDTLLSMFLNIVAFGYAYTIHGIRPPSWQALANWADHYYFSAVTFSTLGFGDFAPEKDSRVLAGLEAIVGNLHLGMIVGAAFFATTAGLSAIQGGRKDGGHQD
ncbi:MAG: ion channel [Pseudomonadota bacterium]